jgi:DNA-binding transcriptional LysR family regulator
MLDFTHLFKSTGFVKPETQRRPPIGAAFLKDVEAILSQLDLLETKYAGLAANQDEEVLTVGASYGPSTSLIPTLMTQFSASHPTVNLDLYRVERTRIENLLMTSQIDIAITTLFVPARATILLVRVLVSSDSFQFKNSVVPPKLSPRRCFHCGLFQFVAVATVGLRLLTSPPRARLGSLA